MGGKILTHFLGLEDDDPGLDEGCVNLVELAGQGHAFFPTSQVPLWSGAGAAHGLRSAQRQRWRAGGRSARSRAHVNGKGSGLSRSQSRMLSMTREFRAGSKNERGALLAIQMQKGQPTMPSNR